MQRSKYTPVALLLAATLALSSCETAAPKRTASAPPPQAMAPTIPSSQQPTEQAKAPRIQETLAPKQDEVDALIAKVEAEYQRGDVNYKAGHLEAAKDNFDRAFNMLLQGPVDVHADERLEREFDKITESVNGLEMIALKQGDGFTEQRAEPAPID